MGEKRGKGLKPEDATLWERVARSVDSRLPDKPAPEEFRRLVEDALHPVRAQDGGKAVRQQTERLKAGATCAPAPSRPVSAQLARRLEQAKARPTSVAGSLDRRTRQRMARGNVDIEARLDLHGMGVEQARMRLRAFLAECRMQGMRTVLVITGKGASPFSRHTLHGYDHWHAPERQGRLRRLVPEWLHEPDFAHNVAGFQPAHPMHGGGGAFYVRLRRKDRGRAP